MKVIHLIGGGDTGGAKTHVLPLVRELSKYIEVKMVTFLPGVFTDEAKSMGINVELFDGIFLFNVLKVVKLIKNEKFTLIHSHGAKGNTAAVICKLFTGLPIVTTIHSDYKLDYMNNLCKKYTNGLINTIALRFIDYYIAVSKNFKQMLIERNFNNNKIYTLYNGIKFPEEIQSYSKSELARKYNIKLGQDDVVVSIFARLDPVKDVATFINAAKIVLETVSNVKFLVCGNGTQRAMLENLANELGISSHVYFLGHVTPAYEVMASTDINVLTSISESFPYSILEGAVLKKATVSSNVGGISDLIESGNNGFLFTSGNYNELAEYIKILVMDSDLRNRMGQIIYEKAKENFSLEKMCETQLNIYKSILSDYKK